MAMLISVPLVFYMIHKGAPRYVVSLAGKIPARDLTLFFAAAAAAAATAFVTLYFFSAHMSDDVYWALLTLGVMLPGGFMVSLATWCAL